MSCPLQGNGPSSGEDSVPETPNKKPNASHDLEDTLVENGEPALSPDAVEHLGELLRKYYANLMTEAVPEHLARLIETLDSKTGAARGE